MTDRIARLPPAWGAGRGSAVIVRVVLVAGTRPELIKLYPLALALHGADVPALLVTTDQHHLAAMRDAFVDGLDWPCPVERLGVRAEGQLAVVAEVVARLPERLRRGDLVVVEGDTSSVLAASLVANALRLTLAHVEAGLRSFDDRMPEEHNRRIADHLADELFAPTAIDAAHLEHEACRGRVWVVGNTVLDAVRRALPGAPAAPYGRDYVLVTLHRQENVDDPGFLREVVGFFARTPSRCVWPLHPRTRDRLERAGLWDELRAMGRLEIVEPLDYPTFLAALRGARVVVTDSGGVQEEATWPDIRRPTVVVRRSTERVAALEAGFSVLAAADAAELASRVADTALFRPAAESPFGDGHAAERIVDALRPALRGAAQEAVTRS